MTRPMIELQNVTRSFQVRRNAFIKAVDDLSLTIDPGEVF